MLGKRFQQQSNIKFVQLYYFSSQNVGGDKRYYVPRLLHKLGPWLPVFDTVIPPILKCSVPGRLD